MFSSHGKLYRFTKNDKKFTISLSVCTTAKSIFIFLEMKKMLLKEGFENWTRHDFNIFCDALIEYGSENVEKIQSRLADKSLEEVTRYIEVFLERGPHDLDQFPQIKRAMIQGNKLRASWQKTVAAFKWKCAQYADPASEMTVETKASPMSTKKNQHNDALIRLLFEVGIDSDDVDLKIQDRIR